jgi:hypothetical protein
MTFKPHHHWTPEEDQEILDTYKTTPNRVLAEKFGVKENAVAHRYMRLTKGYTGTRRNYKKAQSEFLVANWSKMTIDELSKELGFTKQSLCSKVFYLRKRGFDLPKKDESKGRGRCPIGYIKINKHHRLIKTANGWEYYPVQTEERKQRRKKEKAPKQPKPPRPVVIRQPKEKVIKVKPIKVITPKPQKLKPITVAAPKRAPKKAEKVMKTVTKDYSQMMLVQVDRKTWKYIKRTA